MKEEYRAIIGYNLFLGLSVDNNSDKMPSVLGKDYPHQIIIRRYKELERRDFGLADEPRPGRPSEAVTSKIFTTVKNLLNDDRRITYRSMEKTLHIRESVVHRILHEYLEVRKVCTLWVPHALTEEQEAA